MTNITHTKKILLTTLFLIVIIYSVYGFLFLTIKGKNEKASVLSNEANIDMKKEETLRATKLSISGHQKEIDSLDSYFVAPDGVVGFIERLESLGKEAGVSVSVTSVLVEADSKNKNDFKENLRLRMSVSGSWSSTFYFIALLENLPQSSDIKNADFSLSGANDKLDFTVGSTTQRRPSEEEKWKTEIELIVKKLK